jgi:hypothetical protein
MQAELSCGRTRVDLKALINRSIECGSHLLTARGGHPLNVRMPDEPISLPADPIWQLRVIANLIARVQPTRLCSSWQDNGITMKTGSVAAGLRATHPV